MAEWRGYGEPRPLIERVQAVGALVAKTMQASGWASGCRRARCSRRGRKSVGDFIAAHSAAQRLKDGVLYVRVLQPTVHFEMDRMRRSITES